MWYRITLRDKLYESLEEFEFVLDSARSAAETPDFAPKCAARSFEIAIFAHMLDHAPRMFEKLRMVWDSHHTQTQPNALMKPELRPINEGKITIISTQRCHA